MSMSPEVFEIYVQLEALEQKYPGLDLYDEFEMLHNGQIEVLRILMTRVKQRGWL